MSNDRLAIIGGCGFVGIHLTQALAKRNFFILVLDVADLPQSLLYQNNIIYQKYDILLDDHLPQILNNFKPSAVIDIAGWGMSGPDMLRERCLWINVEGTENVLKACKSCNIPRLIYTSTYNVAFCGKPIENGTEELPYAKDEDHLDKYSVSKTKAEKLVLENNGATLKNGAHLMTAVIRPAAIYGEGEKRHLPRIIKHIDNDMFQFRIGSATVDWVHVENLVKAYVLLLDKMLQATTATSAPAGQAYCISDGSPIDNFVFLKPLCEARGKAFPKLILPVSLFLQLSSFMETIYYFAEGIGLSFPIPLTRAEVVKVGVTHYFSIEKARKDFGYEPEFDSTVGAARLALHYSRGSDDDYFEIAAWYWYLLIVLGMWLTYRVAFFDTASNQMLIVGYDYLEQISFAIFRSQLIIQYVFYAALAAHLVEALIAFYISKASFKNMKYVWLIQTLILGYPSLQLILSRSNRNPDAQISLH